jgi:hypothetical protein
MIFQVVSALTLMTKGQYNIELNDVKRLKETTTARRGGFWHLFLLSGFGAFFLG